LCVRATCWPTPCARAPLSCAARARCDCWRRFATRPLTVAAAVERNAGVLAPSAKQMGAANRRRRKKTRRYKDGGRHYNRLPKDTLDTLATPMSSAVSAGLAPKDGPRSGGSTKPSAGLGSYSVHKADGQQRPNYGKDVIDAAHRRHDTDPAIRKQSNWI